MPSLTLSLRGEKNLSRGCVQASASRRWFKQAHLPNGAHASFGAFATQAEVSCFELDNLPYTRVVADVRDPEAVVQQVRAARWGRLEVGA